MSLRLALPGSSRFICPCTRPQGLRRDRKSTRLNSSHGYISYAVFCLKKKKKEHKSKLAASAILFPSVRPMKVQFSLVAYFIRSYHCLSSVSDPKHELDFSLIDVLHVQ